MLSHRLLASSYQTLLRSVKHSGEEKGRRRLMCAELRFHTVHCTHYAVSNRIRLNDLEFGSVDFNFFIEAVLALLAFIFLRETGMKPSRRGTRSCKSLRSEFEL